MDPAAGTGLGKLAALRDAALDLPSGGPFYVSEWGFIALVRGPLGLDESVIPDDDAHAVWRLANPAGEDSVARAALLAWCRDPPPLKARASAE